MMRISPWSRVGLLLLLLSPASPPSVGAADEQLSRDTYRRIGEALANRKIAAEGDWAVGPRTRGQTALRDVFKRTVRSVPLVVSGSGLGSGVVIGISQNAGIVITNQHVVDTPLVTDKGQSFVVVLFFDPQLAAEPFDSERMAQCFDTKSRGVWCQAVNRAMHVALIVGTDTGRDLALLLVPDLPKDVTALTQARASAVQPGPLCQRW